MHQPCRDLSHPLVNKALVARPRFREISENDLDDIADLLTRGFVHRKRDYWNRGLQRQRMRALPLDVPRYGFMLENEGKPVGCLLLIYATKPADGETAMFCNVSSWYVDPDFRNYAPLLASMAQKRKDVTYVNVSPAAFTWPVIEAQGFEPYCMGLFFSLAGFSLTDGTTIEMVTLATRSIAGLVASELEILVRHAEYGCVSLVCHTAEGPVPFVFLHLRKRRGFIPVPAMQLGYCRSIDDYTRCAAAIGRFLLWRGKPVVIVDANGPIADLPGFYSQAYGRKYFRGPPPAEARRSHRHRVRHLRHVTKAGARLPVFRHRRRR